MSAHHKIHNLIVDHCKGIKPDINLILKPEAISFFEEFCSANLIKIIGNTPWVFDENGHEIEYLGGKHYLKHDFINTLQNMRYIDIVGDLIPMVFKREDYLKE